MSIEDDFAQINNKFSALGAAPMLAHAKTWVLKQHNERIETV